MFRSRCFDNLLGRRRWQAAQLHRRVRLRLESLEDRLAPATSPTSVIAGDASITFYGNGPSPSFTIPAAVNSPGGTVNEGSFTMQLLDGSTVINLTSPPQGSGPVPVSNDSAIATINPGTLPPLAAGTYQVVETYTDTAATPLFSNSSGIGILTVTAAPTMVVPGNATITLGNTAPFTIPVGVNSPDGTVNSGSVTVSVVSNNTTTTLGTAPVSNGVASVSVSGAALSTLPAGHYQLIETYTDAVGGSFSGSTAFGTLTVNPTPTPSTSLSLSGVASTTNGGTATVPVAVNSPGGTVDFGTVTISLVNGGTTTPIGSAAVTNGSASVPVTIPAGLAAGDYTLIATYADSTGHFGGSSALTTLTVQQVTAPLPPQVAALELAVDAAMLPLLSNPGAQGELQLFADVFLHMRVSTSVDQLIGSIQGLYPQTGGLGLDAIGESMLLADDLVAENPM